MSSKWIEFVKKWAKDHDTTYACALSQPECRNDYRGKKERELMSSEDVNVDEYPSLIDELVRKSKELRNLAKKAQTTGIKTGLDEKLNELRKIGRDKYGNLYLKEAHKYFTDKYGKDYFIGHPTAYKDKYWNAIDLFIPIWDETEELLNDYSYFSLR